MKTGINKKQLSLQRNDYNNCVLRSKDRLKEYDVDTEELNLMFICLLLSMLLYMLVRDLHNNQLKSLPAGLFHKLSRLSDL